MIDLNALAAECGVKFYDEEIAKENGSLIYRVFITKNGGVGLSDCEKFSRLLSPILDVEPPVEGKFLLEVSSPGLERKLTKAEHFANSIGEMVRISLNNGEKIEGEILEFNDEILKLKTQNGKILINFSDIKKAKTFIIW